MLFRLQEQRQRGEGLSSRWSCSHTLLAVPDKARSEQSKDAANEGKVDFTLCPQVKAQHDDTKADQGAWRGGLVQEVVGEHNLVARQEAVRVAILSWKATDACKVFCNTNTR